MSPLEKMARAIAFTTADHKHTSDQWWESLTEDEQGVCMDIARAAVLAIREPERGSPIIEAVFDRLDDGQLGEDYSTSEVWRAGIDAILNQEPRP